MMTTVRAVYNGTDFIPDEDVHFDAGQEVFITFTGNIVPIENIRPAKSGFSVFHKRTERGQHVEEYMREMRGSSY